MSPLRKLQQQKKGWGNKMKKGTFTIHKTVVYQR